MLTGGRVGVSQDEPFSKHASLPAKVVFSFIVLLILISIGTVYVDSMPGIDETTKMVVEVLELVCSVVFLIEVAIRFVCMESLVICISDPFMWIDVRLLSLSKIPAGVGGWWWLGERHVTKGEMRRCTAMEGLTGFLSRRQVLAVLPFALEYTIFRAVESQLDLDFLRLVRAAPRTSQYPAPHPNQQACHIL